jgi:hypothetical protein
MIVPGVVMLTFWALGTGGACGDKDEIVVALSIPRGCHK